MGYLSSVVDTIQEKMVADIEIQGSKIFAAEVYQILDKCYNYYIREKKTREKLVNKNVLCNEIREKYGHNRNIAMSIIAACNIWIENSILFQSKIDREIEEKLQDIDPVLMVDLYVYGAASTALSTLSLSKNIPGYALYYGVDINLKLSEPISLCRDHPIIYYDPLLAGNQHAFSIKGDDYKNANMSAFGKGFIEEYKIPFVESLRVLSSLQEYELKKGRFSCIRMTKEEFEKSIAYYKQGVIDCRDFWNAFVLTKEKIEKNRQNDEQIIWKMSVNKERHELRPIICFDDNTVFVSYAALDQAKNIWLSYYANGGMAYSDVKDQLTRGEEKRCEELAKELVKIIEASLRKRYHEEFVSTNVKYQRIFGEKDEDYGDYDVVFYSGETSELFLVEAKYFSDSFNASGRINDYNKLFGDRGYYHHCKERYKLVMNEPEKIKEFIGASGKKIKVHFLFVTSKPLEIELQDSDKLVTFIPIRIFDEYLAGALLPPNGSAASLVTEI